MVSRIASSFLLVVIIAAFLSACDARTMNSRLRTLASKDSKEIALSEDGVQAMTMTRNQVKGLTCSFCQVGAQAVQNIGCDAIEGASDVICTAVTAAVCEVFVEICDPICIAAVTFISGTICPTLVSHLVKGPFGACSAIGICKKGDKKVSSTILGMVSIATGQLKPSNNN